MKILGKSCLYIYIYLFAFERLHYTNTYIICFNVCSSYHMYACAERTHNFVNLKETTIIPRNTQGSLTRK